MVALRKPEPEPARLTLEEFFAFEDRQSPEDKWELLFGRVYAMAGGTMRHANVTLNIAAGLHRRLRGGPCRPYAADANVSDAAREISTYPDVVVRCGEPLMGERTMADPNVIFEVTSPSTEHIDFGVKVPAYQGFASLQAYVLVRQDEWRLELWRRDGEDWIKQVLDRRGDVLTLPSLGVDLPLSEIYEGIEGLDPR